jgi:two-component system response regulator DevR
MAGPTAYPLRRLLLVDDEELIRVALRTLFETIPNVRVVGEAGTMAEALSEAERLAKQVDMVILEARLPDTSGVEACRILHLRYPDLPILMLSGYNDEVVAAMAAGARGYVTKSSAFEHLVEALRLVGDGGSYLSPLAVQGMIAELRSPRAEPAATDENAINRLNEVQREILQLLAEGKTNRQIATMLNKSANTVKIYVGETLHLVGLHRRTEAAAYLARVQSAAKPEPPEPED